MLKLDNASITFYAGTVNERKALDHVSLHLKKGDFATVIGSNGAGKSTMLNAISGTYTLDSGKVILDGAESQARRSTSARVLSGGCSRTRSRGPRRI